MQRRVRALLTAGIVVALVPGAARAQWGFWPADSLLAAGKLVSAESAYYAASRERPRDPVARAALGRYLAARGAPRVGAVLLEEAQFFGGDSTALARVLVPVYVSAGAYGKLDSLRPNVLGAAERRRVKWLAGHPPQARLGDSVVVLTYRALGDGHGLGTLIVRVGKTELPAVIDPRVFGLVVPASVRGDLRTFGEEGSHTLAVADVVRVGGATFMNVPAAIGDPDEPVRIGFDLIAAYYPGFDPRAGLMTLRRVGRHAPPVRGVRVPALFDANGLRLLVGGHWHPGTSSVAAMLLGTRRWSWDARRGDVVLSDAAGARP